MPQPVTMAIERLSDRIAQDTCSVLLLLAFTLIRVSVLRSGAKNAHYSHILPSELFSVLCLVVTTCCVVVQVAVSEVDNRIKFSLKDPVAIDAHEYQPVTLQVRCCYEIVWEVC